MSQHHYCHRWNLKSVFVKWRGVNTTVQYLQKCQVQKCCLKSYRLVNKKCFTSHLQDLFLSVNFIVKNRRTIKINPKILIFSLRWSGVWWTDSVLRGRHCRPSQRKHKDELTPCIDLIEYGTRVPLSELEWITFEDFCMKYAEFS